MFDGLKKLLPWLPATVAVSALLYLTLQSPNDTTELSNGFQRWVLSLWPKGQAPEWAKDSHLIRSLAHIPEYFILGCCFFFGFHFTTTRAGLWAVVTCSGFGLLDEGLKYLLPTREFDLGDWCLDLLGILLAVGIMALISMVFQRRRVIHNMAE